MTTSDNSSIAPDTIRHLQSPQVTLTRERYLKTCTVGTLRIQNQNLVWNCKTLELPWLDNRPQMSCIPKGRYMCNRVKSSKFGETFQVLDVDWRNGILFHAGNTAKDTHGCILLGLNSEIHGNSAVLLNSRAAMQQFRQILSGFDFFDLVIS